MPRWAMRLLWVWVFLVELWAGSAAWLRPSASVAEAGRHDSGLHIAQRTLQEKTARHEVEDRSDGAVRALHQWIDLRITENSNAIDGIQPRADPSFRTSLHARNFISIRSLWLYYLVRKERVVYRTALTICFFSPGCFRM